VRRVALTGGIGTGKSYCLSRFVALGAPTIDADALARAALSPGGDGILAVRRRFGDGVFDASGQLDRAALGRLVFGDAAARRDLEAIVHPFVYAAIARWFAERDQERHAAAIADIPLLYETGRERSFDVVVVAWCPAPMQIARVMSRDRLSRAEAEARLAAQMPIDDKARRADHIIDTSGTFQDTDTQIGRIWEVLARQH
jgi:dephospho-CoA kinase